MSTSKLPVYYVTAHQDDWQLFRGEIAWTDLHLPDVYGIFITVTAGDAGRDDGYWEAREAGEIASVLACLPGGTDSTPDTANVNGHDIQRTTFADSSGDTLAVLYSLRLPDGNIDGSGFSTYGNQSIQKLRNGDIEEITAVNNSTTYSSWPDLVGTIQTIMANELETATTAANPWENITVNPWVNANQYWFVDPDHSDHVTVGLALAQFTAGQYSRLWWESYQTEAYDANLSDEEFEHKQLIYQAYRDEMTAKGFPNNAGWDEEWAKWGDKSYSSAHSWDISES